MKALICGVSGQDGAYLARFLLEKGYEVIGTSRDALAASFPNLARFGIADRVQTVSMAVNDFRSVLSTLKRHCPDEVYNLASQSSVGLSFEQPVETIDSIVMGTLNLLEAMRFVDHPIRFYSAGSSECFGDTGQTPATEDNPFRPRSPYAVAKASAHGLVTNYREAYGLSCCTGILFNHESPLRPERFVTQKIVRGAARIAQGTQQKLRLGNLDIQRDWGWAEEYVVAMWLMLQREAPIDYVIATGRTVPLEYFVSLSFSHFGLKWADHVVIEPTLLRPSDIRAGRGNPARARAELGWHHTLEVEDVVGAMCVAAKETVAKEER